MMCENCNKELADKTPHEIFFGTSGRKLSIKYGLQIRLGIKCHAMAHGRFEKHKNSNPTKREMQQRFCVIKGIDFEETNRAINTHEKVRSRLYLEEISKQLRG